jgi:hypothetical protein
VERENMDNKSYIRQDGYEKGFVDGKRTGGKINKPYITNLFKKETCSLTTVDSAEFIEGWHEGFIDAVNRSLNMMVQKESLLKCYIYETDLN